MPRFPDPLWKPSPYFPPVMLERWRKGVLAGSAKHQLVVRIRPGHFKRAYQASKRIDTGTDIEVPGTIWKGVNKNCWKAVWTPLGDWITLPQIQEANYTTSFQNLGEVGGTGGSGSGQTTSVLTAIMDNVRFEPVTGPNGLYHTIERGYFSPMRGAPITTRPKLWASSDWTDALNGGYQIELWEGYGPDGDPSVIPLATPTVQTIDGRTMHSCAPPDSAIVRTWTGIIETCEMVSDPDHISITARDYGVAFTDQRAMGVNKAKEIRSPLHFADWKQVLGQVGIGGPYTVSSGHKVDTTGWVSAGQNASSDTQWIEIDLPAGYYQDFQWAPRYANQEMWVSIRAGSGGAQRQTEGLGDTPYSAGWIDYGLGSTPDGTPFIRHWPTVGPKSARWNFDITLGQHCWFKVSSGSKLRITLRKLVHDKNQPNGAVKFFTGMRNFIGYKMGTNPSRPPGLGVNAKHWILVDDAADVIRMLFVWCGFREWNVENFGWGLAHPLVYGEDKFFMDIANDILAQGNVFFWMAPPTMDDRSIGVPVFRHQTATDDPRIQKGGMPTVRDTDMMEAINMTWDNSNLPHVIRVRGNVSKDGQELEQDTQKRFMATYWPPWSGSDYVSFEEPTAIDPNRPRRNGGIHRHFTETLGMSSTLGLDSNEECLFACILCAIQFALGMVNGTFQIAGMPMFNLNMQCAIIDEGSGTNSRLWVASIQSNHKMGENGSWHMTIGGALVDTEDLEAIATDYVWAWWLQHGKKTQTVEQTGYFTPAGAIDISKLP